MTSGAIDPARRQQLQLLLEVGELLGGRIGTHHGGRVAVEGDHHGRESLRRGEGGQLTQERPMAQVHAVVGADRDGSSGHRA